MCLILKNIENIRKIRARRREKYMCFTGCFCILYIKMIKMHSI